MAEISTFLSSIVVIQGCRMSYGQTAYFSPARLAALLKAVPPPVRAKGAYSLPQAAAQG